MRWGNCIKFLKKYYPTEASVLYFNNKPDIVTDKYPGKDYCSSPDIVKAIWLKCYNKDPDTFTYNEHEHIKSMYYDQLVSKSPIQPVNRALQECMWSWAVHKGVSGALTGLKEVLKKASGDKIYDAIYDYRYTVNKFARYGTGSTSEREVLRPYLSQPVLKEGDIVNEYKKIFTVDKFIKKLNEICYLKTAYVYGSTGEPITIELIDRKTKEIPSWYTAERIKNLKTLSGKGYYGFDCSNLLKALFWGWTSKQLTNGKYFNYASYTVPDKNADGIIQMCTDVSTDMANIEIGEALWFKGHVGIYIGVVNGVRSVIDCTPSLNKVCVNAYSRQKWLKHGKLPWINYLNSDKKINVEVLKDTNEIKFIKEVQKILNMEQTGKATTALLDKTVTISATINKNHALVTPLERHMKSLGYYSGTIEADIEKQPCFCVGMAQAIKQYQKDMVKATVVNQDGVITKGGATWKRLLNI